MIYHFNKRAWQKGFDYDDSYCIRSPRINGRNIISLNKKYTKITEHDDYLEVEIDDWYIKTPKFDSPYYDQTINRIEALKYLSDEYENEKNNA